MNASLVNRWLSNMERIICNTSQFETIVHEYKFLDSLYFIYKILQLSCLILLKIHEFTALTH